MVRAINRDSAGVATHHDWAIFHTNVMPQITDLNQVHLSKNLGSNNRGADNVWCLAFLARVHLPL